MGSSEALRHRHMGGRGRSRYEEVVWGPADTSEGETCFLKRNAFNGWMKPRDTPLRRFSKVGSQRPKMLFRVFKCRSNSSKSFASLLSARSGASEAQRRFVIH